MPANKNFLDIKALKRAFTLIEMLLATSLLALVTTLTFMTFTTVTRAWKRGTELTEAIHHGDFVIDNISMALRSAYYPDGGGNGYGLIFENNGDGDSARDVISWVKLGSSLVGRHSQMADSPHRVRLSIEDYDGRPRIAVRAWRIVGQPESFDSSKEEPEYLSARVSGLDYRLALKVEDGEIKWEDEWDDDKTNRLPRFVEVTVHFAGKEGKDSDGTSLKRIIEIPTYRLSWKNDSLPNIFRSR